jgi:nucleoside 2-deoxyribosyltransferase
MGKCFVCPSNDAVIENQNTMTHDVRCPRCGKYRLTFSAADSLVELDDEVKPRVSRWIHDQCALGTIPRIAIREIEFLRSLKALPFENRANRVLLYIDKRAKSSGARVRLFSDPEFFAIAESFQSGEVQFILKYLRDRKYVQYDEANGEASLTGDGYIEVDRRKEAKGDSIQGFVAMWFAPEMDAIWREGLKPAIEEAGYEPIRLDETEHNNKICDEIIAKIRRARFVVADFTGQSRGVYYEAGFAAALGLPVIFTYRQQGDDRDALHFDVRQFNTIDYTDAANLRSKLTARISATIGDGPRRRPDWIP